MRDMGWQHDTRSNKCNVMRTQNVIVCELENHKDTG